MRIRFYMVLALLLALACQAWAIESENYNLRVLPVPGKITIDGATGDWDLSGGIFACGDAENLRDKIAVWIHGMYDADNLYILARWKDETPLSNPGSSAGDFGFNSDSLQFRIITGYETPDERVVHLTCWRDRDGLDVMEVTYGRDFKGGGYRDAQTVGAAQAFTVDADGKGYSQEMAIPWKLLTKDGAPLKTGQSFITTVEPNFSIGTGGRLTIKDIFRAGVTPDRIFTFRAYKDWGVASLEAKGHVAPAAVRLADAREFPVTMQQGVPVVDWTGLLQSNEPEGFKIIKFTMPQDGYISLNIKDKDGVVVRQLLNCAFYAKGPQSVKWDGLTSPFAKRPGTVVPAGSYTVSAIYHTGISVLLRGWANNAGSAPWDRSRTTNWGGDHGKPTTCATDGKFLYLGWDGSEAGRALVVTDMQGNVQWRHTRGGMGGAGLVAVDKGIVYVVDNKKILYRLDSKTGGYSPWAGSASADRTVLSMLDGAAGRPDAADALEADNGVIYLGFRDANLIAVADGKSGNFLKLLAVNSPRDIEAFGGKLYVVSGEESVVTLDPATGKVTPLISGLQKARGVALDAEGNVYVSVSGDMQQTRVFSPAGAPLRTIGRAGGRKLVGQWTADGMYMPTGIVVDAQGKLWVMEQDDYPKRVSVWDSKTGAFVKEFFGPTHYGASGGAINPVDPNVMIGTGCEWRINPANSTHVCLGVFARTIDGSARYAIGANGRLYITTANQNKYNGDQWIKMYERVGDGNYPLRATIFKENKTKTTKFWADENGDGLEQAAETATLPYAIGLTGYYAWSFTLNTDLTLYGGAQQGGVQVKVAAFTACNAPKYDLANVKILPSLNTPLASPDNKYVVSNGDWFTCYDVQTGKQLWSYPSTYSGVHGSHQAPAPEVGLIRGAFGLVGSAVMPEPLGRIWAVNTNVGEWHLLTEDGFYLTRLFQGDPLKMQWPEKAVMGANLDNCPPGSGSEDFGGSMAQGIDGKVYIQTGKVGLWNTEVSGLNTVKALPDSKLTLSNAEIAEAGRFREKYLQEATGAQRMNVAKLTPTFTGNLNTDFKGATIVTFKKQDDAAVRSAAAWDAQNLYLAWEVKDRTPWVNGSDAPEFLYARGDTVDFQLGANPQAKKDRAEAALGDLRLSIGNFQGTPTAVIYRAVSAVKKPKTFSSGVIRAYPMDYVDVVAGVNIVVKINPKKDGYLVEAGIPFSALGVTPAEGLALRGDLGVTHSDASGADTGLRTYWNNKATGMISDEVYELKMEPKNWGEFILKN